MECINDDCGLRAVFHVADVEERRCTAQHHFCEEHARAFLVPQQMPTVESEIPSRRTGGEVQIELDQIVISEIHDEQVLYMREVNGRVRFPFLTGIFEATAIDRMVKGVKASRPFTHNAMASLITVLGGHLERTVITSLRDNTYYSELQIRHGGRLVSIDIRLSDAVAVSILLKTPIWIAHDVFQMALRK